MKRRDVLRLLPPAAILPGWTGARAADGAYVDLAPLRTAVGDRLIRLRSPLDESASAGGAGAEALFARLKNPYAIGDDPALTQTLGWTDGWSSAASAHAVAAESAADVAAAVRFARAARVPLVVKGGGHSYFGNSSRAGALLVWTRRMQSVVHHDAFLPDGCEGPPLPAVSLGAGAIWGRVYREVSVQRGRYVQGGGCLTVGVAGFVLGGGFGSFSKEFGTGAANLLEAELVTADGEVRLANRCTNPDLFFALKGGGGGTFGIVTRLTLRTHELPPTIGAVFMTMGASSDESWLALVDRVVRFARDALLDRHWGEQLRFAPGRVLQVSLLFHSLDETTARAVLAPLLAWFAEQGAALSMAAEPVVLVLPGRDFWNPAVLERLPGVVLRDDRPGASPLDIFWAGNQGEAGQVIHAYQSAWLPRRLLDDAARPALAEAIAEGSAAWPLTLHLNKGLAGASQAALGASRETAMNPAVLDAAALLICGAEGPPAWPGIPGHVPDPEAGRRQAARVRQAMAPFRALVPDAGAYLSEADYLGTDWARRYWGPHHARLLAVKQAWDPDGLFGGHHTVGSA